MTGHKVDSTGGNSGKHKNALRNGRALQTFDRR